MSFLRWTFANLMLLALSIAVVVLITGVAYYVGYFVGGWFDYSKPTGAVFAIYFGFQAAGGALKAYLEALAELPEVR